MTFYKYKKLTSKISYKDIDIENVDVTKFLGLYVDSELKWKKQADILCSKLSSYAYALYRLSKVVNQQAVLVSYHAYVTSTLRYGVIFWGNCTKRDAIFRAQKKCVRSVCHLRPMESCRPYFAKLKILPFPCLYVFEMAMFVRKNLHMFKLAMSKRLKSRICVPRHKTALFKKSVLGMGPKIYNHLPKSIRECNNLTIYRRKLYNFLLAKCYYNLKIFFKDKITNL